MKLEYEEIEDSYDDTTKIRTMTEQAIVKKKECFCARPSTAPHQLSVNVVFLPGAKPFEPVVS
jgi:hypothetical protein